jgi:hypothetical protein
MPVTVAYGSPQRFGFRLGLPLLFGALVYLTKRKGMGRSGAPNPPAEVQKGAKGARAFGGGDTAWPSPHAILQARKALALAYTRHPVDIRLYQAVATGAVQYGIWNLIIRLSAVCFPFVAARDGCRTNLCYINGAADDEVTYRRNTSFGQWLVPNVLRGVENVDLSVTVMGQKLALPVYCSPTALQRLFHHQGERDVAAAAAKYGTMLGVSSLSIVRLEELRKAHDTPQIYQFYFHKDRGLNRAMLQRAKDGIK